MNQELNTLFFELLQVAIGVRSNLSRIPESEEWQELYAIACRQSLQGVTFAAVQHLRTLPVYAETLPKLLHRQWLAQTAVIQKKNQALCAECEWVCQELQRGGIESVVLKGQSNLGYYPANLRDARYPGDIDLWCRALGKVCVDGTEYQGMTGIIEYCLYLSRQQSRKISWDRILYYHCDAIFPSEQLQTEVEVHYRPTYLCSPLRNRRLQKWFRQQNQFGLAWDTQCGYTFPVPTVKFNAVYQLLHLYKHLFEGGIGLRQLLDYYFVLLALRNEQMDYAAVSETLQAFGLKTFSGAVMYVLQRVFAMPRSYLLGEPDDKEGSFLLEEILRSGNLGKYDARLADDAGKGTWKHFLVKNRHNLRLLGHYSEELCWEPVFRVYHWIWRRFRLWRMESCL